MLYCCDKDRFSISAEIAITRAAREGGAEVELGRGMKVPEVCKKLGIAEYTYYRWRREYGGLRLDQARRLKKLMADLSLDNAILREAAQGNFSAR